MDKWRIKPVMKFSKEVVYRVFIVCFFLIVIGRAFVVFTAVRHSNSAQKKNFDNLKMILAKTEQLINHEDSLNDLPEKKFILSIRENVNENIHNIHEISITNNRFLKFTIFSMVFLSILFVFVMFRYNNKIKNDNKKLESNIAERKIAEAKLEEQNKELTKANSELDSFVYSVSHDLRAPLTSLMGLISIIEYDESDGEKMKLLDMMKSSVEKLDLFIMDIIEYSRNARLKVDHEKIDFSQIINGSIEQLQYMEEAKKIKITADVEGDAEFFSDRKRITVLFNNFISNAIKYHKPDQANPFIKIRVKLNEESAEVEVSDNGQGIPQVYIDKIFDMFYRATEAKSGSGLGLYIVKEIIEKLGGKVGVRSEEGVGSTFYFSIPNRIS